MALQLGQLGMQRAVQAMTGESVASQSLYLSFYFNSSSSDVTCPISQSATLSSLADWEIQTPGTNGYARVQINSPILSTASYNSADMLWESYNTLELTCFTSTGALAQTPVLSSAAVKGITFMVISNQASANTATAADIHAFGPLFTPVYDFSAGDSLVIPAGDLRLRQS